MYWIRARAIGECAEHRQVQQLAVLSYTKGKYEKIKDPSLIPKKAIPPFAKHFGKGKVNEIKDF